MTSKESAMDSRYAMQQQQYSSSKLSAEHLEKMPAERTLEQLLGVIWEQLSMSFAALSELENGPSVNENAPDERRYPQGIFDAARESEKLSFAVRERIQHLGQRLGHL